MELNRNGIRLNDVPNAEECGKFWSDTSGVRRERQRGRVSISVEKIRKQCRKIPNWKAPRRDSVQEYWIKNLSSLHEHVSSQMNKILMEENDLPE